MNSSQKEILIYKIGIGACKALKSLSTLGYSHGDLKLQNICIGQTSPEDDYKITLIDFGLAE